MQVSLLYCARLVLTRFRKKDNNGGHGVQADVTLGPVGRGRIACVSISRQSSKQFSFLRPILSDPGFLNETTPS
jgi:hypothetical protein